MIVGLIGHVHNIEPTLIALNVRGVVYGVQVSLHTSSLLQEGQEVHLYTSLISKEGDQSLFGFLELEERALFVRLIKISGVGPKIALAILSVYTPSEFATLLETQHTKALQKVPGVGSKLASKIMFDLEGYLPSAHQDPAYIQAVQALESLGFKSLEVQKVCADLKGLSTEEMIKEALQKLR
ncbi:Holliday junction branch migration protein RuvA [Helicobacter felis]|uniref:Holliday junction branch migration protein RuvA n=1 Tax=Helicobacter felis TaxID=214 RepID=UPI000CF05522|nr:Holliday junction branch migration protein RuvA [Helicobacter felis]